MKTRIISGIVMALIVATALAMGIYLSSVFITLFIAAVTVVAVYEMLRNAVGIKSKSALTVGCVFSFLNLFALDESVSEFFNMRLLQGTAQKVHYFFRFEISATVCIVFFIIAAMVILIKHRDFTLTHIIAFCSMPIILSFAFSCLGGVLSHQNGIFYLLMLLNFSSICDTGAYFVGSTLGKHKLCPEISPKKTVEGAVGGIISSVLVTLILCFAFSLKTKLIPALILTVPFCILGMVGDLFASAIKRTAGIKDYGTLIPGHGGILDRFDSIIMIAPLFSVFVNLGVI